MDYAYKYGQLEKKYEDIKEKYKTAIEVIEEAVDDQEVWLPKEPFCSENKYEVSVLFGMLGRMLSVLDNHSGLE